MRRKVKKTLTFLTALVMVVSLVCGSGFSAFAENMDVPGEILTETGEQATSVEEGSGSAESGTYGTEIILEETLPSEYNSGNEGDQGTTDEPVQETSEPVTSAPEVTEAQEPVTSVPEVTEAPEPVTTVTEGTGTKEPEAGGTEVSQPETGEPEGTESGTNAPEGTEPGTNAPEGTEQEINASEGTEHGTETPEVTEPGTEAPEGTEAGTETPEGTEAGTEVPEETESLTEAGTETETETESESGTEEESETEESALTGQVSTLSFVYMQDDTAREITVEAEAGTRFSDVIKDIYLEDGTWLGDYLLVIYDEEDEEIILDPETDVVTGDMQIFVFDTGAISTLQTIYTTFTPTISNADVAYIEWNGNNINVNSLSFTPVTGTFTAAWSNNSEHYFLFFVKPHDNYLLTGLNADGNGDIYPTTGTSTNDFGNIKKIAAKAKAEGYVAMFGYYDGKGGTRTNTGFAVNCQSPGIQVSAFSDKTTDVKPNDELTFTVTIKPEIPTGKYVPTVEGVTINTITVNGQPVEASDLRKNDDGTYTATVPYTATADDCASGEVQLDVTATVEYSGKLAISDTSGSTGSVNTNASVTSSASTSCLIAPQNQVNYSHTYDIPDGIEIAEYPEVITGNPVDEAYYYEGDIVTVDTEYASKSPVTDETNGGTWTFDGWYLGNQKVTEATMDKDGLKFTGVWTFTPTYYNVTIQKTVAGNMGDQTKKFSFTASAKRNSESVDLGDNNSFRLSHGEEKVISNVRPGTVLTVTEEWSGYEVEVSATGGQQGTLTESQEGQTGYTITVNADTNISFTNRKQVSPPTGLTDNAAPYLMMLLAAVGGMIGLLGISLERRKRSF